MLNTNLKSSIIGAEDKTRRQKMFRWLVFIQEHEYRVEAETRIKAIAKAARLFRDETKAPYSLFFIGALARCVNLDRKKGYARITLREG